MATLISGKNCGKAWRRAVKHLLRAGVTPNLIVEIADTTIRDARWWQDHEPRSEFTDAKTLADVALTIWPLKLNSPTLTRFDAYARYLRAYPRGMRTPKNRSAWGTYAFRLIAFGKPGTPPTNQLETAIDKINTWTRRAHAAFVFHLTSPELGGPRTRGALCLQYIELLWNDDDTLDMVAVYRSHDYSTLALGNFIGLCDLLAFICQHTRKTAGKLTVHSVYAFIEGKGRTKRLIRH